MSKKVDTPNTDSEFEEYEKRARLAFEKHKEEVMENRKFDIHQEDVRLEDEYLLQRLSQMKIPGNHIIFSRKVEGIHEIGHEPMSVTPEDQPTGLYIPGLAHEAWSGIKIVEKFGEAGFAASAITPLGMGQSDPVMKTEEKMFKDDEGNTYEKEVDVEKPTEEWLLNDQVQSIKKYILKKNRSFVLIGYSQGGLIAAKLAEDPEVQPYIKMVCLLNSVLPSNFRCRVEDMDVRDEFEKFEVPEGRSPLIFKPAEHKSWFWNDLFIGSEDVPDEMDWFRECLNRTTSTYSLQNDYRGENGWVDPKKIKAPFLEICGTNDMCSTTTVYKKIKKDQIYENYEEFEEEKKIEIGKICRQVEELDTDLYTGDLSKDERKAEVSKLETKRKELEAELIERKKTVIKEKRIKISKSLKDKYPKSPEQYTMEHLPTTAYIAHENPDFQFQHIPLLNASHGDVVLTDKYVELVMTYLFAAMRTRFNIIQNLNR